MIPTCAVPASGQAILERHFTRAWRDATLEAIEGTTNFVARLEIGGEHYALRVPRIADTVTRIDRHSERCIMQAAAHAGIAPQIVAYDEPSGTLITRWIAGAAWSHERARQDSAITAIAQLLRQLHGLRAPAAARRIDLHRMIEDYLGSLHERSNAAIDACRAFQAGARSRLVRLPRSSAVLCHNDAHHRNIVAAGRLYLLDWEYAGLGEALFDLAAYASYHDLDDDQTRLLLDAYGAGTAAADSFADWRWLFEYVWALWLLATTGAARSSISFDVTQLDALIQRLR